MKNKEQENKNTSGNSKNERSEAVLGKKPNIFLVFKYFLFSITLLFFPSQNYYFSPLSSGSGLNVRKGIDLPKAPPYPVLKEGVSYIEGLTARGVFVQDIGSGVVLLEKKSREIFSPASTTKIMTALVAMDKWDIEDSLTAKTIITEGRVMNLAEGESLTLESLLYGILVHSANDAAYTIAENYPGGVDVFVEKMNEKAKEIGLENTGFANPIGFDDPAQYTTPRDLAKQALVGLKDKRFSKIVSTRSITVSDIDYINFHSLTNVNELLGRIPGVAGVKTGFTQNAGEVLVSEVKQNGKKIIIVVLDSKDRFGETSAIINWVFANYQWVDFAQIVGNAGVE